MTESWERIYWLRMADIVDRDIAALRAVQEEYIERAREANARFQERD